jgi:S1-C subfamily serine protease
MSSMSEWVLPVTLQPRQEDFAFDLPRTLASMVGVHALIPEDAFTAQTLGTERSGNGVVIDDGLVLTIGYLITEAETVWLNRGDGRSVEGHALAYDQETGFGLVQALGKLQLDPVPFGDSAKAAVGSPVVVGGAGGRSHSLAGRIVAKEPFAGYWEYALEEAIFTGPAHPNWGGTGLLSADGRLLGIGSLQLERGEDEGRSEHLNMIVPIDLLKPILTDLVRFGRVDKPARPWLGVFATEVDDRVVIAGISPKGPAAQAQLKSGDVVLAVGGVPIHSLGQFYRRLWATGAAGVEVPLTLHSKGVTIDVVLKSADRARFLRVPRMH